MLERILLVIRRGILGTLQTQLEVHAFARSSSARGGLDPYEWAATALNADPKGTALKRFADRSEAANA